jgi:hypothetical protein
LWFLTESATGNESVLRVENDVRYVDIARLRHPTFQRLFSRTGFGRGANDNGFVAYPDIDREIPYEKKAPFSKRFL